MELEQRKKYATDHRIQLFNLDAQPPQPDPVEDPVFGLNKPELKLLSNVLISELLRQTPGKTQQYLYDIKQSYLKQHLEVRPIRDDLL